MLFRSSFFDLLAPLTDDGLANADDLLAVVEERG